MRVIDYDKGTHKHFTGPAEFNKSINTLKGIVFGITADELIVDEIHELHHWMQFNHSYISKEPFKSLIPLLQTILEDNIVTSEEKADILWVCDNYTSSNPYFDALTSDMQILFGMCQGLLADNVITNEETLKLRDWLIDNETLQGHYPYDEIMAVVTNILKDGRIDEEEKIFLKAFLSQFIDIKKTLNLDENELIKIKKEMSISGICAVAPDIIFDRSKFCFTGESMMHTRKEMAEIVLSLNGEFKENVTKDLNYLVVGNNGSDCWAFSCFGRKVEQAVSLRKKGFPIVIVDELDFWDALK